ncbi:MAG: hypothetical protein JRI47_04365 [Deltaproteobacteria bacterium]|nr:hypothetical protein [Deltaproteobacteria bacterium]
MARSRFLILQTLLGVVVFAFCACQQVGEVEKALLGKKTVKVSSTEPWIDTGFDLKAAQTVQVKAEGAVFINEDTVSTPNGVDDPKVNAFTKLLWRTKNVMYDAAHGALIGKIGEEGKPFLVGEESTFTAESPGRLYLGVNDKDRKNNQGAYIVKIVLQ